MTKRIAALFAAFLFLAACAPTTLTPTPTPPPGLTGTPPSSLSKIKHIFVVVMENHRYDDIWGSSSAPYINSLGAQFARAANYHAVTYPSLPNYLQLFAGTNDGITNDCSPSDTCRLSARNLGDSLDARGLSWKAYMESMPAPCSLSNSGDYVVRHNPLVYFDDIRNDPLRCAAHDVPFSVLTVDLVTAATTPSFAFISPNVCNDMHDCSIATGDTWLQTHLPDILNSPACTSDTCLLILTWDEDDRTGGNHVLTIFAGSAAQTGGAASTVSYTHYSLLRTVETIFGLPALTVNDEVATPMFDLLR